MERSPATVGKHTQWVRRELFFVNTKTAPARVRLPGPGKEHVTVPVESMKRYGLDLPVLKARENRF